MEQEPKTQSFCSSHDVLFWMNMWMWSRHMFYYWLTFTPIKALMTHSYELRGTKSSRSTHQDTRGQCEHYMTSVSRRHPCEPPRTCMSLPVSCQLKLFHKVIWEKTIMFLQQLYESPSSKCLFLVVGKCQENFNKVRKM